MFAPFVRLEVQTGMPQQLVDLLTRELDLNAERDVYHIDKVLDLSKLMEFDLDRDYLDASRHRDRSASAESDGLKYRPLTPVPLRTDNFREGNGGKTGKTLEETSMFDIISRGDVIVHHPYESFENSTLRFLQEASSDEHVLAIKATVYRTSSDSPIIQALLRAAGRGRSTSFHSLSLLLVMSHSNLGFWINQFIHVIFTLRHPRCRSDGAQGPF